MVIESLSKVKRKYFNILQVSVLIHLDHQGSADNTRLLLLAKFINYFAQRQNLLHILTPERKVCKMHGLKVHESKTLIKIIVFDETLFMQFPKYSSSMKD